MQCLITLAFYCLSTPLVADLAKQHQAYERLLLPGGRAALMGGAYTALSNDPVGLLYNPGGSVFSDHNEVSVNTWSAFRSEVIYQGAIRGSDFKESSQARSGGFAGGIFKHQPFTLGYVVASLDKRNINQDDYFADLSQDDGELKNFTRVHQESNAYDLLGASLGVKFGSNWGLGTLIYIYDRSIESMDYQKVEYNGGRVLTQQTKIKVSNQGMVGILGLRYKGEHWSLGLSIKRGQPVVDKSSLGFISVTQGTSDGTPQIVATTSDDYTEENEVIPTIARTGLAWHPIKAFLLSLDLQYSSPLVTGTTSPNRRSTLNYALGMDTGGTLFRFLAGVYTNNSTFPRNDPNRQQQATHLDYVGQSLGLMFLAQSYDVTLGYVKQVGKGTSQITTSGSKEKVSAIIEHFVVSWNFKLR